MRTSLSWRAVCSAVLATIAMVVSATAVDTQSPSDAQIETTIRCAQKEVKCDAPVIYKRRFTLQVSIVPPIGRVFLAAAEAKAKYQKFTRADVTDEMLQPTVRIRAIDGDTTIKSIVDITHVVLMPEGSKEAVQPAKIEAFEEDVKNLMGASFKQIGQLATFNVSDLPAGDFDVVLIGGNSRTFKAGINGKDRQNLARWTGSVPTAASR